MSGRFRLWGVGGTLLAGLVAFSVAWPQRDAARRLHRAGGRRRLGRPRVRAPRAPAPGRRAAADRGGSRSVNAGATALAIAIGYAVGAIPFGVLAGRLAGGIDLRAHGSGRTGSTNALRTLGLPWAAAVLAARRRQGPGGHAAGAGAGRRSWRARSGSVAAAAVAAIIGTQLVDLHRAAWRTRRGDRGWRPARHGARSQWLSCSRSCWPSSCAGATFRSRSITGAVLAPVVTGGMAAVGWASGASVGYGLAIALLVTGSHLDNIRRLRAGTERTIGH